LKTKFAIVLLLYVRVSDPGKFRVTEAIREIGFLAVATVNRVKHAAQPFAQSAAGSLAFVAATTDCLSHTTEPFVIDLYVYYNEYVPQPFHSSSSVTVP
jgi:hypothetical protein